MSADNRIRPTKYYVCFGQPDHTIPRKRQETHSLNHTLSLKDIFHMGKKTQTLHTNLFLGAHQKQTK